MTRLLFAAALLWALPTAAQPAALQLGETTFPNSGAAEAQEPFLQGILLLHSFEYDDAREAFQEARRIDPDFALAAWGEAMTHNHPVWQRQDRDAALAALESLGAGWSEAGETEREDAYLATLAVLFGEGPKEDRDDAYAEAMADLAARFPDDLDAQSFYALSLLGTAHEGRDFATYMEAAAVAEEVFDENPRHPGAAHYLIHAYDDPVHAPLGLRPARVYADVAPAASHALHMPSHIYLALGMWDDVADMNRRSYEAAKAGTDRRGAPLNGHGWHALWWWHYAATQQGDRPEADRLLALALAHGEATPDDATAQAHVVRVAAEHAVAFDDPAPLDHPVALAAEGASNAAILGLARGVTALGRGDLGAASAVASDLDGLASGDDASWAVRSAALQLRGRVLIAEGETTAGLDRLRDAAEVETAAPLTFGPPSPVVPSNEAHAQALAAAGRASEAEAAYRSALDRAPNRRPAAPALDALRAGRGTQ